MLHWMDLSVKIPSGYTRTTSRPMAPLRPSSRTLPLQWPTKGPLFQASLVLGFRRLSFAISLLGT